MTPVEIGQLVGTVTLTLIISTRVAVRYVRAALAEDREKILAAATGHREINGWLYALVMALPYPAWVKVVREDADGRLRFEMLYVNRAYEHWFGVPSEAYEGRTDYEIWPHEIADGYYQHDAMVYAKKQSFRVREPIEASILGHVSAYAGQTVEFEKQLVEKEGVSAVVGLVRPDVAASMAPESNRADDDPGGGG